MRATFGLLSALLLLPAAACDDGNDATCPEGMYDTANGLPCSQPEGTRCVYDCNGCGYQHDATCKGGVWVTFYTCECPADGGYRDSLPPDTTPPDTTPADTTPADTTPADTTPADTQASDGPGADGGPLEGGAADAS